MKFEAVDILAYIMVGGGLILKALGFDGVIDTILISVASFYFGLKITIPSQNGNKTQSGQSKQG